MKEGIQCRSIFVIDLPIYNGLAEMDKEAGLLFNVIMSGEARWWMA